MADLIDRGELRERIYSRFGRCSTKVIATVEEGRVMSDWAFLEPFLNAAPAVNRWIPCSERMPEDRDTVLTCDINKNVRKCEYFAEFHKFNPEFCDYYAMDVSYVTHWMPLPEPPEKEVRNG